MKEVVIVGATRTAIGKFGGSLADVHPAELGAIVIKEALNRARIDPAIVDEVIVGCVLQAGLGMNIARQASIRAGLPIEKPAMTLNTVCGSSLKAVNLAALMIKAQEADVIVVAGVENMSNAPYLLPKARFGYRMNNGITVDSMVNDGLWEIFNNYHMGVTAENIAEQFNVTKQMQDEFAALSQQKCENAQKQGKFNEEIVSVFIKQKKESLEFKQDEYPRSGVTFESINKLPPAFKIGGTVTAANSSGINDGAAAMIVMSAAKANELNVLPMARFIEGATSGVEPALMGLGPISSTHKALTKARLAIKDLDLYEVNEAFAVQSIAVMNSLDLDPTKLNVNGGAIALGHPIGASGCRILVTLLHEMKKRNSNYGLASLCVGGGMGVSTIVQGM